MSRSFARLGVWAICIAAASTISAATATGGATAKPALTVASPTLCLGGVIPFGGQSEEWMEIAYANLVRFNGLSKPLQPELAKSWTIRPGNKVITFDLRRDARFSDGTPVTASAVKTWLDWRKGLAAASDFAAVGHVTADVVSKYKVRITLASPNPRIAQVFSSAGYNWGDVVSPRAVIAMQSDPRSDLLNKYTFGAGPYVLDPSASTIGDTCTFVPNKYYYDKSKQQWGKIVTRHIGDPNSILAAMKSGQVDVAPDGTPDTAAGAASAGLRVLWTKQNVDMIAFLDNGGKVTPALGDVRVRQALNYAIDRKTLARALDGSHGIPTSSPNPFAGTDDPKTFNYYSYDLKKAKSLMASAGYANGFTLKILSHVGSETPAQAACKYLAAIKVKCDINITTDWGVFGQEVGTHTYAGLDAFTTGTVSPSLAAAGLAFPSFFETDPKWYDPVTNKLYLKAQRLSGNAAQPLFQQIVNRSITQGFSLPIASPQISTIFNNRVGGISRNSQVGVYPADWYPTTKS